MQLWWLVELMWPTPSRPASKLLGALAQYPGLATSSTNPRLLALQEHLTVNLR